MPSEKMERLAAQLVAMAEQVRQDCSDDEDSDSAAISARVGTLSGGRVALLRHWRDLAEALYAARRHRDRLFGPIFGEPAWDVLLDLFVMEAKGVRVSVSSACIASGTSHSTALRQIDELARHGLVERTRDEHDKRRTYIRLSDCGLHKLSLVLEQFSGECSARTHPITAAAV